MPRLEPMKTRMDRMKSLYLQGYDLAYISEEMGVTPGYIEDCLKKMKVWEDYGGIDVPKVLALRRAGWHMAEILYELGQKYTAKQVIDAVTANISASIHPVTSADTNAISWEYPRQKQRIFT